MKIPGIYFKGKKLYRYFAAILFGFALLICKTTAYCSSADTINRHIFANVEDFPQKNRVVAANGIYKTVLRRASTATAMACLNQLTDIAKKYNDKSLECAVIDMRADYYCVNHGFNPISTRYYQAAIDFAAANNLLYEKGLYLYKMGMYHYIFVHNASACQYFLRAEEVFNQVGFNNVRDIGIYLSEIASFYYSLGDFENAKIHLETALRYLPDGKRDKINAINTIGLVYRNYRQFPQALSWFNQTLNMAKASKDSVWMGIATGNIGSVYFLQHQYQKAIPDIETDFNTSIKHGEKINAAIALLRLIKINIDGNNFKRAETQLDTVASLIKDTQEDVMNLWVDYYDLKSQLYEQIGRIKESINLRKVYEQYKDSIVKRNNISAVERVKLRWEIDKHITQVSKLTADEKIHSIKVDATIALLMLLIIISSLLYNRQRLKDRKDKELLLAEKQIADERLRSAGTALQRFTENLRQKNMLIENFKKEIERLDKQSANKTDAGHLEKLLQAHIMTDDNWNDFKKLFAKVYPGFFIKLNKNYSQLSATDTRMLALMKLGLSNTEMANMLGITIEGIKKAKQRLKKKLGAENAGDLEEILSD